MTDLLWTAAVLGALGLGYEMAAATCPGLPGIG